MRAESAAAAMRLAISEGEFAPGEQLIEVDMVERLEVSRNTVREAFAMLIADGLLIRIRNRGVFIAQLGPADIADLYLARAAVEPAALAWGDEVDVDKLHAVVAEAESALAHGDTAGVALANQRFHRRIVAGMGSATLNANMDRLLARMRLVFLQVLRRDPDFHSDYVEINRRVVTLLQEGKKADAAEVLHHSLMQTSRRVQEIVAQGS
ncbi:GntR family transcriptional regulator [Corynebacterium sp.]|uniref:GntR family transcriptional regulator n=1 Tax=Corynebacterium sp. TaxID=1720 RepID=UPI0026E09C15|nr:GntR family transcriptional regulator [Corynebacterium sp.]MDO5511926.1 GntR family transcriptional regulator [Corynebacterium sp.]